MNKNTNTQTDTEMTHMSLQIAHFFPHFFKAGKYLLPLLAGLFILAACGGGGAAPAPAPTPDTTEVICANNLFDDACNAPDVETKRNEKIEECFTGDAAGNADCKNAVEEHSCLEDPFDATCTADTDFAEYLEPAKKARAEFCRQGNNISEETELCGNAVTSLCPVNPFDTVCFADATYRDMRIVACSGAQPPTDSATVCRRSEITDIVCAATGANAAPLNTEICGADDGVIYAAVRQEFCRANPSDNLCATTISTFCATIDAVKFTDSLCGTSASAAVRGTYCVGLQAGDRPGACGDDATEGSLIRAYCEGGSAEALLDTANCATSLAKACETAPFGHACTSDDNIRAQAVMCRANTNGSNSCDATRTVICEGGGAAITANIFDDLCDVGYDNLRTIACVNAPASSVRALPSPKCGSEITTGYLFIYCRDEDDGATNNIHCPVRYAASGVRAERWQTDARDATNENDLTIIPAGGASKDDILTNFIVGGEEGLGFVADGTIITEILREGAVKLDILDDSDDGKSGFGWASVRRGDVESFVFRDKSYIGLLSGTDVGAPIHDNTKTGVWNAKLTFLSRISAPVNATFILDVSFGPNTLKTRAGSLPIVHQDGSRTLSIDGKFTDAGVLYGTTDFYTSVGSTTSAGRGTLSGVIGVDGAVGIFASDNLETNTYTGGFVATLGGCTDYPFNAACTSDVDIRARANACLGDIMTNGVGGCDDTITAICRDGTTGSGGAITANILDPLCHAVSIFDDQLVVACNNDITDTGVYNFCPDLITRVCPATGPRNPECEEPTRTGNADYALWQWNAVKADKTTPLNILPEIGEDDPPVSYVEAERGTTLQRGFLLPEGGRIVKTDVKLTNRVASFANLGVTDGIITQSGVTLYRVNFDEFEGTSKIRHYAGLWLGTDLGAPLRADTNTKTTWNAFATLYLGNRIQGDNLDFTLEVDFSDKTIKAIDKTTGNSPIPITHGRSAARGLLTIDGKFTELGVIYGSTEFAWATDAGDVDLNGGVSTGSLTGLIGEYGAVGAFISDGDATAGTYVGGFIAMNPNACDATPFSDFCKSTTAYNTERLRACNTDTTDSGNFADCATFTKSLCPNSGTRHELCPELAVTAGKVDFVRWAKTAKDAPNANPLTILPAITGSADPDFNYVEGRVNGLEVGDVRTAEEKEKSWRISTSFGENIGGTLKLSELAGGADDTGSGVALRLFRIRNGGNNPVDGIIGNIKYHTGILSNTDLGAPISAAGPITTALWDAKIQVLTTDSGVSRIHTDDFTMEVNFNPNTIKTRDTADAVILSAIRSFRIGGEFTADGVIYGTTTLRVGGAESTGSLTGLIGERGAVGVFLSDISVLGGVYAGGFVAVPMLCEFYPFGSGCNTDDNIMAKQKKCNENPLVNGVGGCDATFDIICRTGSAGAIDGNPFDPFCLGNAAYDDGRVSACLSGEGIGNFAGCDSLLENLCPLSGARNSQCPAQVQTGNADFIRWKQDAVDTKGVNKLAILPEVGNDDAGENYVQAGNDDINLGILADENGNLKSEPSNLGNFHLNLGNLGLADDTASGVRINRYRTNEFIGVGGRHRYYVGIFSGTDLGAPLTVDNSAETIWNAKLLLVDESSFIYRPDFTLEVNFSNKTIRTRVSNPIKLLFSDVIAGTLILTGKFTTDGVIYGTSRVELTDTRHQNPDEVLISDGSLTGLIGEKGAVGAFISDGALDGAGRYVGGFVARNTSLCRGDTLFDTNCYKSPRIIRARADMCEGNMNVNGGAGGCVETVMDICSIPANSDSAINPFHMICNTGDDTYDESRSLSCANNRNGYSGTHCALLTTQICDVANDNKPLNTICADGTNTYDVPRQALCAGASIDESLKIPGCEPVITALCRNANAFSGAAGAGDAKFNCSGSDLYHVARQDACLYGSLQPDVCTATIDKTCNVDKEYFSGLCKDTNDDNFEIYEQARINTCADNADEIQSRGATAESGVIFNCFDFLDVDCSQEPFEEKCYVVNLYESKRLDKCSSDLDALEGAYATPADCNRAELSGVICAQTGENANPFAPICAEPTAVAVDFDLVAVQQGFCRDGANINGADCADTITNFCDVASGADLFDNLCNTGDAAVNYTDYRVAACRVDDANTLVNSECGNIISTNCTGEGPFSPACVTAGTLPTSVWVYTAPNADNTGRLEILAEAQQDDADTNYVQGNATGLNLGFAEQAGDETVLSITDLDNVNDGDAAGGVAFVRITFTDSTPNKVKYYAGLLDNVDLGRPLADRTVDGIWHASFSAIVNGAVQTDTDTSIVVNYDTNSLTTNDDDLVALSNDAGSITIDANFTAAGVIYGTSSWTVGDKSSAGSVTGLIGAKGAIGAFVSSGENTGENTDGEYVGGFVAAPVAVECVGAVAFTNPLCDGAVGKAGRIAYAETCRTTECTEFVDRSISTVTFSVCTHRMGGDPHQAGCESDGFEAERIARNEMCITDAASYDPAVCGAAVDNCFASGTDNNCGQLAGAYCDVNMDLRCDNASALAAIVCRDLPLDSRCDTGYDAERQTACGGEDVTTPRMECESIINTLCLANPLDNAAGAGKTKFDCAGSVTYKTERETACAGQDIASPLDSRCAPVIADFCNDNPFNNAQSGNAVAFNCLGSDNYHTARRDVCYEDIITNSGTNPACTATIAQACTDDIFDGLCFDRADGKYSDYETDRVSYCQRRVFSTSGFTLPTVEGSTVCSAFIAAKCDTEPFEARCTIADDDAYASQRLGLCGGTITDLTAAYATPADCNTADLAGVICDTGNVLAINPFAPICSDPTAIAIIDNLDLVSVQQGFCRDGANINDGACDDTIANFCDVASGRNLFDELCNTGDTAVNYLNYRVAVCEATDDRTGEYDACTNILSTNCPETGNRNPACEPAEGTLPTSVWLYTAPNADNTGRLKILDEVQLDDADMNYVQGDADGLNLGALLEQNGDRKTGVDGDETVLSITSLDNVDDAAVGSTAFVRINYDGFTTTNKIKYYAGLLDNVDLGGPVPETTANAIWNASFSMLPSVGGARVDTESSIIVNFNPNTLKTRDDDDPVMLSGNLGSIEIDADFTSTGVIFGTSTWVFGENSLTGSVTGLIGKYGAIGAFVGSGETDFSDTLEGYVGGFVATPVDCTQQTGNPFYRLCFASDDTVRMAQKAVCDADVENAFDSKCAPYATETQKGMFCDADAMRAFDPICDLYTEPEEKTAFAETCRMEPLTTGCDRVIATVSDIDITVNDCTDSDTGNPYQTGCGADVFGDVFAAERTARDLSCTGSDVYDASQCSEVLGNCFNSIDGTGCDVFVKAICDVSVNRDGRCDTEVPMICTDDPLSIVCETGYDEVRQMACATQDIALLSEGNRCLPVISALCDDDPFNDMAGVGTAKFNCTEGDTYLEARVTACENDIDVNGVDGCDTTISTACPTNPFSSLCDNTYQGARDMACDDSPAAYGDGCEASKARICSVSLNDNILVNLLNNLCRDDPRYAFSREQTCLRDTGPTINQEGVRYDVCRGDVRASVIAYRCSIDPFNLEAGVSSRKYSCSLNRNFDEIRSARVTLCKDPMTSGDPLCQYQATQAFLASCARDPFNSPCRVIGDQYETERVELEDSCRGDVSLPKCDVLGIRARLCTIDELPFAPFCDKIEIGRDDLRGAALRVAFCNRIIDDSLPADSRCVSVTAEFCPTAFGADAFNTVCDENYTQQQVAACRVDAGLDAGCTMLLETNCPEGNTKPECAIATATAWENYAVNEDNTDRLTVLDEIGTYDPRVNYVKAGADGLDFSGLEFGRTFEQEVLKSYDGGTYEDTASGVAFGFTKTGDGTNDNPTNPQSYYAGILSGTDLGGPVTNTTDTSVDWTGKFGIMVSGRYYTKDFTLNIDFTRKSISGTDANITRRYDRKSKSRIPNITETLVLAGRFNDAGVIYGTSQVTWSYNNLFPLFPDCVLVEDSPSSSYLDCPERPKVYATDPVTVKGSLTGLIGERGAVGVFTGFGVDNEGKTRGSYVGGFVVDNPDVSPDCSVATGTPFDLILCRDSVAERVERCIEHDATAIVPSGFDADSHCKTAELLDLICEGGDQLNSLNSVCTDDRYDYTRQLTCSSDFAGLNTVQRERAELRCGTVTNKLCTAEPFNQNAGPGENKFDCAGDNSEPIIQARKTRIALCLDEATDDDPLCKQGDFVAALASCVDNPLAESCSQDGVRAVLLACIRNPKDPVCTQAGVPAVLASCTADLLDTSYPLAESCTQGVSAIVTACVADRAKKKPESAICAPSGVPVVLATCAADPFDAVCTGDIAEHYTEARNTRLTTCRGDATMRGDAICAGSLPTICASGDTPFSDLCDNNDIARIAAVESCLAPATADADVCDAVVLNGETVKGCIADPYNEACADTVFYSARAAICESEATSFTAGCLTDSNFASTYSPVEVADDRRADLITRCTDSKTDNDEGCHTIAARTAREALIARCADSGNTDKTNCDTPISGGTTLAQCIENPFLTDCAGTETLARCRQLGGNCSTAAVTTALMTYRNAFVARCADSGNTDKMGCDGAVNGGTTIASCITAFNENDCARSGAFNAYRGVDCTLPANAFAPRCQGGVGQAVITARAELALGCAVTEGGTGCDTTVGSSGLTVVGCNADPFAPGCEDAAFANARFEMCKTAEPKPAACGVKEGQSYTSYVQGSATGLELGDSIYKDEDDLAVYREDDPKTKNIHEGAVYEDDGVAFDDEGNPILDDDPKTPIDESKIRVYNDSTTVRDESKHWIRTDYDANKRVLREGIEQGGLTLNDLVDATNNENHGFAYAYIPGGRGVDDINGWDRYYAGLLSGTDVGASITADAMWNGKVSVVNGTRLTETADFVLTIDFNAKTLTSGDIAVPRLGGYFAINGKFTTPTDLANSGVIYGATRLYDGLNNGVSSIGSVTGFIGEKGAVGAFVSSGEGALVNTFGEYAGGFVASEGAPDPTPATVDCSDLANLNPACANTPDEVELCAVYDLTALQGLPSPTAYQTKCISVLQRIIDRETACVGETDLNALTEPLCEAVIAQACDGNIFNDEAGTGETKFDCTSITAYTATRQQACRSPAYANGGAIININGAVSVTAEITACGAVIDDICTANPFTQTTGRKPTNLCDSSYDDAREAQCTRGISNEHNTASKVCFDTLIRVCNDNPFTAKICYTNTIDFTTTRLLACNADMSANGECESIIQTNCPTDGSPRNAECRSTRFTQWADNFNTDDSDSAVASIPEDETKKARILLGRSNGLDTTTNVTSIHAPHTVLRFNNSKYNRVPHATETQVVKVIDPDNPLELIDKPIPTYTNVLNEDYNSGFAVFSATTTNGTIGHYAGILSGTDVGAPITDPATNTIWRGDFAWVSDDGAQVKRAYGFRLNVNYDAATISTPTEFRITDAPTEKRVTDALAHVPGHVNTDSLSLDAFWNINGVLIGTTTLETDSKGISYGTLTGMIGNDGAVGVFASNDEQPFAYAGGFIAKPTTAPADPIVLPAQIPPTATTWIGKAPNALAEGEFTRSSSRYESRFIIGGEDGFGLNKGGSYEALNYSLSTPTLDDDLSEFVLRLDANAAQDSADYKSGFALFYGNIGGTNSERFFTGLLSGTTVGANLPQRERYKGQATAIWGGVIGARFGTHNSAEVGKSQVGITIDDNFYVTDRNFQLLINFEASTIKTPEGKGSFHTANLRFDGRFDRNGIMSGTVATGAVDSNQETNQYGPGTFTGIIGQDAAIGVLKADRGQAGIDNKQFGYAGGFFVTPCTLDVSTPTCKDSPTALNAFCANRSANAGKNSFHSECDGLAKIDDYRTIACLAGVTDTQSESRCPGLLATACLDTTNDGGKKPFQPGCSLAPDQMAVANAQRDACLAYVAFPDTSCQSLASVRMACEADPFTNTVCATRNDYDAIEGVFCATATGIATANCPNATSGDWVASITDLNTDPATATDSTNEFLQIAEQTISTTGTTMASNDAGGTEPTPTTLNFSEISYDGASFSADDGLAYFSGYQADILYHYAGIFGSTDLGAPITESGFSATWIGLVSINAIATPMYFTLAVTFDGTEGTVDGFIANISGTSDLLIDGDFTASGVLTGNVHYAVFVSETTPETPAPFNGSLSGLIGTDGVVAAFISTATGTDGYAGGFVATPPVGICKSDVFDTECPVREQIPALVAFCTNITDNLGANPFNTGCIETTHGAVEIAQRDACLSFATFPNVACQSLMSVRMSCETDPFTNIGCETRTDYDEIVGVYCAGGVALTNVDCPNVTSADWVAIIADLNTDLAITTSVPNIAPVASEFLQIADNTIPTTGTTVTAGAGNEPIPTTLDFSAISYDGASLSTDDGLAYFSGYKGDDLYHYAAIYGTTDLGKPIADSGFSATWPAMLSIFNTRQETAHGEFRVQEFRQQAFDLKVTFDGNTGTLTVVHKNELIVLTGTPDLRIYGDFDDKGVITGEVDYGHDVANKVAIENREHRNGTLSGLISAEGLAAVFFVTADITNNYKTAVGGFVAAPDPQVIFADWQGSFDGGRLNQDVTLLAPGTNVDGRLMNSAWFIELNVDNAIVVGTQTIADPTILPLDGTVGQDDYKSGVAFWHGNVGATPQYYAGLLPTTDLGAPLTDGGKNGTWTGTIAGVTNGDVLTNTELKLQVMFSVNSNGTIKSIANEQETYTYAVGANTVGAVNVKAPNTDGDAFNNTFDFTGQFNAQGVITGTVAHTNGELSQNANGTFNGLIGVDGAVGVFKSNNNNRAGDPFGYIGGFIARPPSTP